jgi:pimeloyl-ACP methyl ester carboxylesterase
MTRSRWWPSRRLELEDVTVNVVDTGGDLPPVLMLHGLGGYAGEWGSVASLLRGRRRLVAFDQRGHGESTRHPRNVTREAHVRDVVDVMDELRLERVTLVGQSMGAHTAMLTAAAHPSRVSRLVLIEGGPSAAEPQASDDVIDWFESWPTPFAHEEDALVYFESRYGPGRAADAWTAGLESTPGGLSPSFDLEVLREAIQAVHRIERWAQWEAVTCPALIVMGENGFMTDDEAERMLERNPNAQLTKVPAAGHDVHLDAPEAVALTL